MAILFSDLCLLFDRISQIKPVPAGQHQDATCASRALPIFRQWLSAITDASPRDGIVLFRLLFPENDIRRRYGLRETMLARELPKALGFSSDALACWRDGSEASIMYEDIDPTKRRSGCFGHHLEAVLAPRREFTMENAPSLEIHRLDALLDELASHCEFTCNEIKVANLDKPRRPRSSILSDLFSPLSAKEASYLVQIILRDVTPLLYPLPTSIAEAALSKFNSCSYQELGLLDALREWHWVLPTIYRYRADIDEAFLVLEREKIGRRQAYSQAQTREVLQRIALPQIGTRIEIPKAIKGRGCRSVAAVCETAGKVYLETKYDGERMQIHIDTSGSPGQVVTIFSKSKRDSTFDRIKTHPLLLAALGLPFDLSPRSPPTSLLLQRLAKAGLEVEEKAISNIVLEAEMVAYNEANDLIDEFAYIPECAGFASAGPVAAKMNPDLLDSSQTTSRSSTQTPERHLAIVFFDLLILNGKSLVFEPYENRRQMLESVIRPIDGHVMLAERTCIDFATLSPKAAYERLMKSFAKCIVDRQEGLIIKSAQSIYNDTRPGQHWIKLKRDYIPGLGDTASFCIVGASWTKERGRELRVPSTCFTTFYVGVQTNAWEVENGTAQKPDYLVLFSVSHLASREMLLEANNRILQRGGVDRQAWSSRLRKSWTFDLTVSHSCSEMSFVLSSPLVFELYGAGFTRSRGSKYYELRFPRVSAIHHSRLPQEAVTLPELQAMGREASSWIDSEAEDEIDDLWTRCSSATEGEEGPLPARSKKASWRAKQEKAWVEKLEKADRPKQKKRKKSISSPQILHTARRARGDPPKAIMKAHDALLAASAVDDEAVTPIQGTEPELSHLSLSLRMLPPIDEPGRQQERQPCSNPPPPESSLSPHQTDYLWTVFPRQAIRTHCLTYEGRISSLNCLLQQAGFRHRSEEVQHDRTLPLVREAVIFTTPWCQTQLVADLREQWQRQGQDSVANVAVCGIDALATLKEPVARLSQLEDHLIYL